MRCAEAQRLIDLYVEDGLPEDARVALERHALACPACAFDLRSCEQTRRQLRAALQCEGAPPDFREKLSARLHHQFAADLHAEREENPFQRQLPLLMPAEDRR